MSDAPSLTGILVEFADALKLSEDPAVVRAAYGLHASLFRYQESMSGFQGLVDAVISSAALGPKSDV